MTQHSTHPEIVKRLKRASGHLNSVVLMLEEEKGCLKIVQQLQAVEGAIAKAKKVLIHDHIDHCLKRSVARKDSSKAIEEFKEITKYL